MLNFWAKIMSLTDFEIKTKKELVISLVIFIIMLLICFAIFPRQEYVGADF
ncbi:MAG: hypothetical protein [Bacteriophage sp.]|nr:MAG: hypothetical protein [Bacteriophage sp.]